MKLLAWVLLVVLVIWALRSKKASVHNAAQSASPKPAPPPRVEAELMVQCVYCGVHIPASEAIQYAGSQFCSEEHRRLHVAS